MILGHDDIVREIRAGGLVFDPQLDEDQIRESSVDLRLGPEFHRWKTSNEIVRDPGLADRDRDVRLDLPGQQLADHLEGLQRDFTEPSRVVDDGVFRLQQGDFVLAQVMELIQLPDYLAARVEGRTRFARTGLEFHSTAPTIRAGWSGRIVLELKNVGPLVLLLSPGARICQVIFERMLTPPSVTLPGQY